MKKNIITKCLFLIVGFLAMFFTVGDVDIAFAAEASTDETLDWSKNINTLSSATRRFLFPILMLIGALLENDLLYGGGMETVLNNIWIPIRNLVNILFILVLVGVALYNVLGLGDDGGEYAIKSALPKIIAALIVINFSFLGMKVLLDGVNAMTVSILSLPTEMGKGGIDKQIKEYPNIESFCVGIYGKANFRKEDKTLKSKENINIEMTKVELQSIAEGYGAVINSSHDTADKIAPEIAKKIEGYNETKLNEEQAILKDKRLCEPMADDQNAEEATSSGFQLTTENGEPYFKNFNSRNAAMVLALNFSKLGYLEVPDFSIENTEDILINSLFSLIVYISLAASFVALFIVLLFRIVFMWVSIAVSPILVLLLFSPTLKDKLGGGVGDIADKFVKNALAPIPIALALTVGFIMLKAVQTSYSFGGADLGLNPVLSLPVSGLSTPQDIIVMAGTIAVLWMGVFGAAEGTLAEGVTNTIKDGVEKAGKGLATLPIKHLPTGLSLGGQDIKAGHLPSILKGGADKLNAPWNQVANKIYNTPQRATTQDLTSLNKDNARDILRRVVANNPENMSKEDKKALYKSLTNNMTKNQRKAIKGLPDFYTALGEAQDKDPSHAKSKALAAKSTDLRNTLVSSSSPSSLPQGTPRSASGSTTTPPTTTPPTPTKPSKLSSGDNVIASGATGASSFSGTATNTTTYETNLTEFNADATSLATKTNIEIVDRIRTDLKIDGADGETYYPSAATLNAHANKAYKAIVGAGKKFKNDEELNEALGKTTP